MTVEPQIPAIQSPKVYFSKVILTSAFIVAGKVVPFEPTGGNNGVIALDPQTDALLIEALKKAESERRGGILQISEAAYTQKKTEAGSTIFEPPRRQRDVLRPMPKGPNPFNLPKPVATAPSTAAPAEADTVVESVPPPVAPVATAPTAEPSPVAFKPATRRISRKPEPVPAE